MELFKKTYSDQFQFNCAPLAAGNTIRQVLNNYRRCYVKSLSWSREIYNITTGVKIPDAQNFSLFDSIVLTLNAPGVPVFQSLARDMIAVFPPPINTVNGIYFYNQGQYFFNDLFFQNDIFIVYNAENRDLINQLTMNVSLIFEIEEAS